MEPDPSSRKQSVAIGYIFAATIGVVVLQWLFVTYSTIDTIPYCEFEQLVGRGSVSEVAVGQDAIQGKLKEKLPSGKSAFVTARVDPALAEKLNAKGVVVTGVPSGGLFQTILSWIVPAFMFYLIWIFLGRRFADRQGFGGLMSIGKSRAKVYVENDTKVTFADVAGVEEAKYELQELVFFLKDPKNYGRLGAHVPKGILLVGPPGTGKTLLARAVAGEAGVPFFSISGSEFVEMFVGVGAARVRDLFEQARKAAPCIVFVDEIDAVGRQRGAGLGHANDEREQTLNQILVEMDGFDTNTNVIVVAATNRPDVLDPALLRPGRFDRQVVLDRPDIKGRKAILDVHVRGKPLDKNVDLLRIGQISPGFSGADLANVVNEAAILAARRNKKQIGQIDFEEALEKVALGPERRSRVITEKEKWIVAYHEAGHALCFKLLKHTNPVHKISVVSRGMALGYTMSLPQEDRYLQSKTEFEDKIAGLLGGNAAEKLIFGDTTTGAENDIEKATNIARKMVKEYGMSERLGTVALGHKEELVFLGREIGEQKNYSEKTAEAIDEEIRRLIDEGYAAAVQIITDHRDVLDHIAAALIQVETLDGDNLERVFRGEPPLVGGTPAETPPPAQPE